MKTELISILTEAAPKPLGHYSQAIVHNNTVYVATQLGIVPNQQPIVVGTVEEQTTQVLKNIEAILIASGSELKHVIRVTIYLADIELWDEVNRIYRQFFPEHKPARGVIPVKELHHGFHVAMDVIAAVVEV
jgi:2-iminobutanoate/2-iminopropanoate deaminase